MWHRCGRHVADACGEACYVGCHERSLVDGGVARIGIGLIQRERPASSFSMSPTPLMIRVGAIEDLKEFYVCRILHIAGYTRCVANHAAGADDQRSGE